MVTSADVAPYRPLCEYWARKFSSIDYRAEFDDLTQEAWIACWKALERGFKPTNRIILNALRDWVSFVTHEGRANGQEVPG